jgi:hypothetical protein
MLPPALQERADEAWCQFIADAGASGAAKAPLEINIHLQLNGSLF